MLGDVVGWKLGENSNDGMFRLEKTNSRHRISDLVFLLFVLTSGSVVGQARGQEATSSGCPVSNSSVDIVLEVSVELTHSYETISP